MALAAGCGDPQLASPGPSDAPAAHGQAVHPDAIWFEVLGVTQEASGTGKIAAAQTPAELEPLWAEHGFDGPLPDVDFSDRIVLVLARAEDACPDELVEVRLADAVIDFTWLPPPGGCDQPLIPTGYAVALHRADLPQRVTVRLKEYAADVEEVFDFPPYQGGPAPDASPPPRQMSQSTMEAAFAGHALRPCDEIPDPRTPPRVDGLLSGDPEVAEIQRRRAEYALPSDVGTASALRDAEDANRTFGFPMTEVEWEEIMARNRPELSEALHDYAAAYPGSYGFTFLDQPAGGTFVIAFTEDVEGHRRRLAERFPDDPLRVIEAPATRVQLEEAQKELHRKLPHSANPWILGSGSGTSHLEIMVLDPTRERLDTIAAAIDPSLACVDPTLGGVGRA